MSEQRKDAANVEDNVAFRIRLAREDADFAEAEALLPVAAQWVHARTPPPPVSLAYLQMDRGIVRVTHGEPERAATDLEQGFEKLAALQAAGTWYYRYPLAYLTMLRADQNRLDEARKRVAEWRDILQRTSPQAVDMPMEALVVAQTAWRVGDRDGALALLHGLEAAQEVGRPQCFANHARLQLATMALEDGQIDAARGWLQKLKSEDWYDYRQEHPRFAVEAEVRGLLAQVEGRSIEARAKLIEARRLYAATYAPAHWRLKRIDRLLAALPPPA